MDDAYEIREGDCRDVMRGMDAESIDAIVTDPPYGLSFMGKGWDHGVPGVDFWTEAMRVAKPGCHLLAFGGTRTYHRLACAIEDAGWEIRDCVMWVYGSGFPKSHDVSKAIDKAAGAEREVIGYRPPSGSGVAGSASPDETGSHIWTGELRSSAGVTDAARQWSGWGTALKPAWEPIIVARKPLCGTVAENVMRYGTGALNIDGCRVGTTVETWPASRSYAPGQIQPGGKGETQSTGAAPSGRWPANVMHDGSDEVVGLFPVTGPSKATPRNNGAFQSNSKGRETPNVTLGHDDSGGSAARFFYCAKASKADRDEGCEGMEARPVLIGAAGHKINPMTGKEVVDVPRRNNHPTVKPTALMRYLCRLVTQPGGIVLDPFCGSGSTGKAARLEGFRFIGIEREAEYAQIARARISAVESRQ